MELELADDLPALLTLERVDRDLFRARNANLGPRQTLYGGQVAAQCLMAAAATIEDEVTGFPIRSTGTSCARGAPTCPSCCGSSAIATGAPSRPATSWRCKEGEVIFSMLASFHAERESGVYDGAPDRRGAGARGHAEGRPDGAGRGARGDADRLSQGCLHRLPVGPFVHVARATTRCCIVLR